ncbi:DsbA family protein [Granulicella tundricola]|uniref:DSBA oxidoreductase n=1 Tax=Granulicella tundricola (strain ATCC BAA-1859 / DSM 23138 / MP5ACTX9) TaxID=1198114 RepID=E8X7D6_GRATM|nr:DsbA family protein [Granulicella tundricola]ADW71370.1 DSBA oxidoreductase [Granulicella tundricola MP5ACTX9]
MSKLTIPVSTQDHLQGDPHAACSLVEYGDYECPSCGEVQPIIQSLQRHFGNQMSFVFRNFPLREIHPWAEAAAEVAELAGSQGKFWEMHNLLFQHQEDLSEGGLQQLVSRMGLSEKKMQQASMNGMLRKKIEADLAGGIRSGVNGTPTFFLNGDRCDGPTDFNSLASLMDQVLVSNGD